MRLAVVFLVALGSGCGNRSIFADQGDSGAPLPVPSAHKDATVDVLFSTDAGFQKGLPDVFREACSNAPPNPPPPAGPIPHLCAPETIFECDGLSDSSALRPNGEFGNGFDDDCDGNVDEGCPCDLDSGLGAIKGCWLVPANQIDETGEPVGWCRSFSYGTVTCTRSAGDATRLVWSGRCDGASPPFFSDVCAPGDFDCDGVESNSRVEDCQCAP